MATNLSTTIKTRLRTETACETALEYIPSLQTNVAMEPSMELFPESIPSEAYKGQVVKAESRSDSHVYDEIVSAGSERAFHQKSHCNQNIADNGQNTNQGN